MSDTTELMRRIEALEAENVELKTYLNLLFDIANRARRILDMPEVDENTTDIVLDVALDKLEALEAENKRLRERIRAELKEAHKLDLGGEATRIIIWAVLEESEDYHEM